MDPVLPHGWQGSDAGAASPGSLMAWLHAVLEGRAVPLSLLCCGACRIVYSVRVH